MKYYIFFGIFLWNLCAGASLYGQATKATEAYKTETLQPSRLDKSNWAKITKGVNYTPQKPKEPSNNIPDIDMPDIDIDPPVEAFGVFAQVLFWGIIVLVAGFVIFRIVTLGWGKNKVIDQGTSFDIEHVAENLMESDLDRFLREAISKGEYRLAVRLYFLSIIKEMASRELIRWKKDKTNGHYLSELYDKPLYEPFRRVSRIFDYVWYSDMPFDKWRYEQVQPEMKSMLDKVSK